MREEPAFRGLVTERSTRRPQEPQQLHNNKTDENEKKGRVAKGDDGSETQTRILDTTQQGDSPYCKRFRVIFWW